MNIKNMIGKIGRVKKIKKRWLAAIIIVLLIAGYFIIPQFFKSPTDAYVTEKISKGEVLQEVSETGNVEATDNISLGFKTLGKVSKIYVAVGNDVKSGDILASLDLAQLSAQLQSAKAALTSANSQYAKLLNGATSEDLKTAEDTVISSQQTLDNDYNGSINILNNAYTSIYNAHAAALSLQNDYFSAGDQEGIKVQDAKISINSDMANAKSSLESAQNNPAPANIDAAISEIIKDLNDTYNGLKIIRDQCDRGIYYATVSSTDKTAIDTQKTNIYTTLTSVTTLQHTISSDKITLQKAEDALALKGAAPRQEDIDSAQASINQAQANVDLYQSQLNDNYLRSPIDGKITDVNVKVGEVVSPSQSVVNLLSLNPFEIKANIYEEDIVKVKPENSVKIDLIAFPQQTFLGKVVSISPGEKIVGNVVYYEITIDFPNQPEGIMSGMTADIIIEANKKENVLRVSKSAVETIDGTQMAQVVRKGKIEDQIITTGLEGNDYYEIVSGLNEGDEIVTGKK